MVLYCHAVWSRDFLFFVVDSVCTSFCPSPRLSLLNLTFGNAGSILVEITNSPIQREYGVVIWCLSIFSGKFVKFVFFCWSSGCKG